MGKTEGSKLPLDPVHCKIFSWFWWPQAHWPVVVLSSVAYSSFTQVCPGDCFGGAVSTADSSLKLSVFQAGSHVSGAREYISNFVLPSTSG